MTAGYPIAGIWWLCSFIDCPTRIDSGWTWAPTWAEAHRQGTDHKAVTRHEFQIWED